MKGIANLDVKLANIVEMPGKYVHLRLVDFGLAREWSNGAHGQVSY